MPSIFSKIINGDIPSFKIAEDDMFYAFLDINPVQKGHTLVVPKVEVDRFFDLEDEILGEYNIFAKKIAKAIKLAFPCDRVASLVLGLEVPHAHMHLIPINNMSDIDFKRPLKLSREEFMDIAQRITSALV